MNQDHVVLIRYEDPEHMVSDALKFRQPESKFSVAAETVLEDQNN